MHPDYRRWQRALRNKRRLKGGAGIAWLLLLMVVSGYFIGRAVSLVLFR